MTLFLLSCLYGLKKIFVFPVTCLRVGRSEKSFLNFYEVIAKLFFFQQILHLLHPNNSNHSTKVQIANRCGLRGISMDHKTASPSNR